MSILRPSQACSGFREGRLLGFSPGFGISPTNPEFVSYGPGFSPEMQAQQMMNVIYQLQQQYGYACQVFQKACVGNRMALNAWNLPLAQYFQQMGHQAQMYAQQLVAQYNYVSYGLQQLRGMYAGPTGYPAGAPAAGRYVPTSAPVSTPPPTATPSYTSTFGVAHTTPPAGPTGTPDPAPFSSSVPPTGPDPRTVVAPPPVSSTLPPAPPIAPPAAAPDPWAAKKAAEAKAKEEAIKSPTITLANRPTYVAYVAARDRRDMPETIRTLRSDVRVLRQQLRKSEAAGETERTHELQMILEQQEQELMRIELPPEVGMLNRSTPRRSYLRVQLHDEGFDVHTEAPGDDNFDRVEPIFRRTGGRYFYARRGDAIISSVFTAEQLREVARALLAPGSTIPPEDPEESTESMIAQYERQPIRVVQRIQITPNNLGTYRVRLECPHRDAAPFIRSMTTRGSLSVSTIGRSPLVEEDDGRVIIIPNINNSRIQSLIRSLRARISVPQEHIETLNKSVSNVARLELMDWQGPDFCQIRATPVPPYDNEGMFHLFDSMTTPDKRESGVSEVGRDGSGSVKFRIPKDKILTLGNYCNESAYYRETFRINLGTIAAAGRVESSLAQLIEIQPVSAGGTYTLMIAPRTAGRAGGNASASYVRTVIERGIPGQIIENGTDGRLILREVQRNNMHPLLTILYAADINKWMHEQEEVHNKNPRASTRMRLMIGADPEHFSMEIAFNRPEDKERAKKRLLAAGYRCTDATSIVDGLLVHNIAREQIATISRDFLID